MRISNPVPKISLLVIAAVVLYLALISGDPRMADGAITGNEMFWYEMVLVCLPAPSIIATWLLGLWRAHKAGSWSWFLLQLFLFVTAYIYTLFVNRGERPNNSFKGMPLRGTP